LGFYWQSIKGFLILSTATADIATAVTYKVG
jgi:hypothetical protein